MCVLLALTGCIDTRDQKPDARILSIGDSLLAWHALSSRAIPDVVAEILAESVVDKSVSTARLIYKLPLTGAAGLSIPKQYKPGDWDWVIVNGGGNDLWLGCGCTDCDRKLDKLILEDGSNGAIPTLISQIRSDGARVIYVGYLRSPGRSSPIDACKDEGDTLEARVNAYAAQDDGVFFVSLADLVPHGDLSFHTLDRVHPSIKGSHAIGRRIADVIQQTREVRV